ncbi:MAG: heavy metal-binding domain-containing protein [Hassallia sp.]
MREDANKCGADQVVGIKTYVYQLGSGIIEFMAIGTAVKKMPGVSTRSSMLLPQAIIQDRDTFVNTAEGTLKTQLNQTSS